MAMCFFAQDWHLVVLDEAQAIKNPLTKITQLVCQLNARCRLCLSGTPIENHLGELWSYFAFLMPGLLGTHKQFGRLFRTPIEKRGTASDSRCWRRDCVRSSCDAPRQRLPRSCRPRRDRAADRARRRPARPL